MGKLTTLLVILLILGGLYYLYAKNPDVIKNVTDNTRNIGKEISGQLSNDNGASLKGSGWSDTDNDGSADIYVGTGFIAISVNESYVITKDRNNDGRIDAMYIDTTGDGNFDTAYLDEDYNGKTDTWLTTFNGIKSYAWDLSGDGIPDVYDTNGDGKIDAWDLNSDGIIDEKDVDYDGTSDLHDYDFDGIFDEFEGGPNIVPPENTTGGFTCPSTQEEAYRLFVQAYNNVTSLQQANAEQERIKEAYAKYLEAKACHDSFLNQSTATSTMVKGSFGEVHEAVLSTRDRMTINFSTGELGKEGDLMIEPWCVDYPALLGNFIDIGKKNLEDIKSSDIPLSWNFSEDSLEVEIGHVYISLNRDGSYTAFVIVSHEKISDCDHTVVIRYRNLEDGS